MPITAIRGGGASKGQGQFVSVPYGWDSGYKAAVARNGAGNGPIRVWMQGHSIMAGFKATNTMTDCARWLIRNFLVAKYGRSADFFGLGLSQHFTDMAGNLSSTFNMVNPPWLLQTSPLTSAPYGFTFGNVRVGYLFGGLTAASLGYSGMGCDGAWVNPGAAATIATFQHASVATWLETCQAYDLVAPNRGVAAPAMSYNVNGAGANNVNLTADNRVQVIPMATGLTAGKYDTVIKGTAATTAWLSGITAHATTRGAAGVQVAHLAANSSVLSNMESNYFNTLLGLDATSGVVGSGGFPMVPDLVISNHLLADAAQFSPDVSTQRFAQYVEALRRANPNCSIIFVADYRPNGVTTDGAAVDSYALGWPTHIEALLAVAQQLGCAFVSVHDAWQGRGVGLGYITSGELHPTSAGHTNIASLITPLL